MGACPMLVLKSSPPYEGGVASRAGVVLSVDMRSVHDFLSAVILSLLHPIPARSA